jgi:hypothetical protein
MATQETEESPGVTSSMRVHLKSGRRAGWLMIVSGISLSTLMLIVNRGYELVSVAVLLVSTGAGMITGLGFAKAIQSQSENQGGGQ